MTTDEVKIPAASGTGDSSQCGFSVAICGDLIAIGAPFAGFGNGFPGQVYLFMRDRNDPERWNQTALLSGSGTRNGDGFGWAVSLSGTKVVVGAPYAGSGGKDPGRVYVFERNPGEKTGWSEVSILSASDANDGDWFGSTVSLYGNTLAVGSPRPCSVSNCGGRVYLFERDSTAGGRNLWKEASILSASDTECNDHFGSAISLCADILLVGAYYADQKASNRGKAYLFQRSCREGKNWKEIKILSASDESDYNQFGCSVSVSGTLAVIGDDQAVSPDTCRGKAYVFHKDCGGVDNWGEVRNFTARDKESCDEFGFSVAVSGSTVVIGAARAASGGHQRGQAYVKDFAPELTGYAVSHGVPACRIPPMTPVGILSLIHNLRTGIQPPGQIQPVKAEKFSGILKPDSEKPPIFRK
ncbi:MAG: FG-GAP repeat protein [Methanoregulaceae archaeon]